MGGLVGRTVGCSAPTLDGRNRMLADVMPRVLPLHAPVSGGSIGGPAPAQYGRPNDLTESGGCVELHL